MFVQCLYTVIYVSDPDQRPYEVDYNLTWIKATDLISSVFCDVYCICAASVSATCMLIRRGIDFADKHRF